MRMIDADAINYQMLYKENYLQGTGHEAQAVWKSDIDKMPTIDAVPVVHGEWVGVMTEAWCTFDECKCSVCGVVEYFNKGWKRFSYCPNCGARMDGRKDDETD